VAIDPQQPRIFGMTSAIIDRALQTPELLSDADLCALLALTDPHDVAQLHHAAYKVKSREVGAVVRYRGLIEFSNVCEKNCRYCGIRSGNDKVERFTMTHQEIVAAATWAHGQNYGSLVLQAGERSDDAFVDDVTGILEQITEATGGELGVTLSLGEQSRETYRRWREAGAHRYLLRIETSNADLYRTLHPTSHDPDERLRCLDRLRDEDYQVGTGVMIGLPGQTLQDLAADVRFFRDHDVDMIGMGPWIPHEDTPLAHAMPDWNAEKQLALALNMIAVTRLFLRDVNIAAATALQALAHDGRERGLLAGANVIMPNVTDTKYRDAYQLYDGKPCLDENASMCRGCLERRISGLGESVAYGERGDAPHYAKRTGS